MNQEPNQGGTRDFELSNALLDFIQESPSPFHAAANLARMLDGQGFQELSEASIAIQSKAFGFGTGYQFQKGFAVLQKNLAPKSAGRLQ